jgi:hypothetical protein
MSEIMVWALLAFPFACLIAMVLWDTRNVTERRHLNHQFDAPTARRKWWSKVVGLLSVRAVQGTLIAVSLITISSLTLASAVAWGPHSCGLVFIKVVGCSIGNYENLSGGLLAACAAIFAGWLAWNAVQVQIAADEKRAKADRLEVESVLAGDMVRIGEALAAIWRVLEVMDRQDIYVALDPKKAREAMRYGIEGIAGKASVDTGMSMASALGWEKRRRYEQVFRQLAQIRDLSQVEEFEVWEMLTAVKSVSVDVRVIQPMICEEFNGLFERAGKAWSLGQVVLSEAGLQPDGPRPYGIASSWKPRAKS